MSGNRIKRTNLRLNTFSEHPSSSNRLFGSRLPSFLPSSFTGLLSKISLVRVSPWVFVLISSCYFLFIEMCNSRERLEVNHSSQQSFWNSPHVRMNLLSYSFDLISYNEKRFGESEFFFGCNHKVKNYRSPVFYFFVWRVHMSRFVRTHQLQQSSECQQ